MKNSHAILICTEREMKFFRIQSKLLQVLKLFLHSHHLPSRFFLLVLILLYARNFRRRRHIFAKIIFKKKKSFLSCYSSNIKLFITRKFLCRNEECGSEEPHFRVDKKGCCVFGNSSLDIERGEKFLGLETRD